MRRFLAVLALGVVSCGCTTLYDTQQHVVCYVRAKRAWSAQGEQPYGGQRARHFERGWRNGYFDVAFGGSGKPPEVPPTSYWSFKYQNPAGRELVALWYEAYQLGAIAAEEDGWPEYQQIPRGPGYEREFLVHEEFPTPRDAAEPVPAVAEPLPANPMPLPPNPEPPLGLTHEPQANSVSYQSTTGADDSADGGADGGMVQQAFSPVGTPLQLSAFVVHAANNDSPSGGLPDGKMPIRRLPAVE